MKYYITAQFHKYYKTKNNPLALRDTPVPVWENPSRKELNECLAEDYFNPPSARFIALYKDKVVYVWPSLLALHEYIWDCVHRENGGSSENMYRSTSAIHGTFSNATGVTLNSTDPLLKYNPKGLRKLFNLDWGWVSTYLPKFETTFELEKRRLVWINQANS